MRFETRCIHTGIYKDTAFNSCTTPIYPTSTFFWNDLQTHKGFDYTRSGNPTRRALEENIAALEGGVDSAATCTWQFFLARQRAEELEELGVCDLLVCESRQCGQGVRSCGGSALGHHHLLIPSEDVQAVPQVLDLSVAVFELFHVCHQGWVSTRMGVIWGGLKGLDFRRAIMTIKAPRRAFFRSARILRSFLPSCHPSLQSCRLRTSAT